MVSRELLLREDYDRVRGLQREQAWPLILFPCKIVAQEDWEDSACGQRIYGVKDRGIKRNLKITDSVYKILGYCN